MRGNFVGSAEFSGPENGGPKKIKDWKIQDLENDGPGYISSDCVSEIIVRGLTTSSKVIVPTCATGYKLHM